jgi:hypothetical protein
MMSLTNTYARPFFVGQSMENIQNAQTTLQQKRPALQEIDPNIGPPPAQRRATSTSRAPFSPSVANHSPIPSVNPLPRPLRPVQPPISPVQPPQLPLPDTVTDSVNSGPVMHQ